MATQDQLRKTKAPDIILCLNVHNTHTINNKPQNATLQEHFYIGKDILCLSSFFFNKEKESLSYCKETAQQFALGSNRDLLKLA